MITDDLELFIHYDDNGTSYLIKSFKSDIVHSRGIELGGQYGITQILYDFVHMITLILAYKHAFMNHEFFYIIYKFIIFHTNL